MAKRKAKPKAKPKKTKARRKVVRKVVKMQQKAEVKVKETPKAEPKKESWQSVDTAPALTPVHVKTAEGKTVEAILDGHWYVCVDGKAAADHIIYEPTGWKPLK